MVARLDLASVSLAQKPKSAGKKRVEHVRKRKDGVQGDLNVRTNFNVPIPVEKNIVAFDIAVDDVLAVQVCQSFAGLGLGLVFVTCASLQLTSLQMVEIWASVILGLLSITSVSAPPSMYSITTQSSLLPSCKNESRKLTMLGC